VAERMHVRARDERRAYESERDRSRNPLEIAVPGWPPVHLPFASTARVTWRSKAGVWGSRTVETRESPEFG
jgi:hypothetical protein